VGKRSRGNPRNRWRDDIRVLDVKNWTKVVMDRSVWHDLVEKSKTHRGFYNKRRKRIYIICQFTVSWETEMSLVTQ